MKPFVLSATTKDNAVQKEKVLIALEWQPGRNIPGVFIGEGSSLPFFTAIPENNPRSNQYLSPGDWIVEGFGRVKKSSFEKFFLPNVVKYDKNEGVCILSLD